MQQLIRSLFLLTGSLLEFELVFKSWSLLQKTQSLHPDAWPSNSALRINENAFLPVLPYTCSLNMWEGLEPIPTHFRVKSCLPLLGTSAHWFFSGEAVWHQATQHIPWRSPRAEVSALIIFADMTCQSLLPGSEIIPSPALRFFNHGVLNQSPYHCGCVLFILSSHVTRLTQEDYQLLNC